MADFVSDDIAELSAASDFVAWRGDSGSMAARGVPEMISKTSKEEEEDEASLWRESHRRRRKSRGGSSEIMELSWSR
jgi:hypothetical protein